MSSINPENPNNQERPDNPPIYPRPNDAWVCGYARCGSPCSVGPSRGGTCPVQAECLPSRVGSRWECGRSFAEGGTCDQGPGTEGECGNRRVPCSPAPSLRTLRGRWVRFFVASAVSAFAVVLGSARRNDFLAPGPLSQPHAQLLRAEGTQRCQACHQQAQNPFQQWLTHSPPAPQSPLCLHCHDKTLSRPDALFAHGLPARTLQDKSLAIASSLGTELQVRPTPANANGEIACATCHREHQGTEHNLAALRDDQCQVCHQQAFVSFQSGHPDFGDWPYERRSRIAFDHVAHAFRHFPDKTQIFTCARCHSGSDAREVASSPGYATCAECHDAAIASSAGQGVEFIRLPGLDMNLLRERGLKNDAWPESLSNDFDGTIPPLMRLMLRQDAETGAALDTLGPDFDFLDLEPDNDEQFAAMLKVVRGIQALVEDLGGTPVAGDAVSQENQSPKPHEASISNVIPPEVARFVRDWLSEATPVEDGSDKPRQPNNATGWKRDDSLMVLRYVPAGHADAVLVTILEMLARDSGHDITKVQAELAGPGAPGLCRSCHSLEQVDTADGRVLEFQWRGRAPTVTSEITHFQHGPHLQLPGLLECKTCHPLNPDAASATDYLQSDPTHHQPQFLPIQRDACAACHTPQGAGSSCTKCHNYHVGNGPHVEE